MKNKIILFVIFLKFIILFVNADLVIKKFRTIKSISYPDYIFFLISHAKVDDEGNIYLVDAKGCFVRKYNKKGKFVSEFGRKGEGPKEFLFPFKVYYYKGKLYVWDLKLRKFTVLDRNLKYLSTIRAPYRISDFFLWGTKIYCAISSAKDNFSFAVLDTKGRIKHRFFKELPIYLRNPKDKWFFLKKVRYGLVKIDFNEETQEIVTTFRGYDSGNYIYFLNLEGKIQHRFRLRVAKSYKLPSYLLKFPIRYPAEEIFIYVDSIHFVDSKRILLHLVKNIMRGKRMEKKINRLLILDRTGKVLYEKEMEGSIRVFEVKNKKVYLHNFANEDEILQVWEITDEN